MEPPELLLTSCSAPQPFSAALWDPANGSQLHSYKNGGVIAPKCLNLINQTYLLSAEQDKPLTHIWPLNSQEPDKAKGNVLADKPSVVTVCPHSTYLAMGMGAKLYIWHLSSGKLFSVQKKNYQNVSCVKFSGDGALLVSGGLDGMLNVYKMGALVSLHHNLESDGLVEPLYSKQDHALPIVDIYVGMFGAKSRLVSVSSDSTCKVYSLLNGQLLLNLVFGEALTSVVCDAPFWNMFIGQESGKIQQFHLMEPPREVHHHVSNEIIFQGHQKKVTCLDLGLGFLVSGSDDCFVFVWDLSSRQVLRRIEHKAAVTNVKFVANLVNFFVQDLRPAKAVMSLDRELVQSDDYILHRIQTSDVDWSSDEEEQELEDLRAENARLRATNQELYKAAMKAVCKKSNF